jgi:membrane protein implicated in regulation of membrane protease activity
MPLVLARVLVAGLALYAAAGFAVAVAIAAAGAGRIDPSAKGAGWGFRLLIVPGAVALWPFLLRRWLGGATEPPEERNPHRDAASRGAR